MSESFTATITVCASERRSTGQRRTHFGLTVCNEAGAEVFDDVLGVPLDRTAIDAFTRREADAYLRREGWTRTSPWKSLGGPENYADVKPEGD